MAMARASSGPAYPERFYAAASFVGLDGSDSSAQNISSKFSNDTALILYALYQQATVGPCNTPKPSAWRPVEQTKWKRFVVDDTSYIYDKKEDYIKTIKSRSIN